MKIGRYRIFCGRYRWFQTYSPVRIKRFGLFTIVKEANPADDDKRRQFPLGTPMQFGGVTYLYYKKG